jgi:hypothetical protein
LKFFSHEATKAQRFFKFLRLIDTIFYEKSTKSWCLGVFVAQLLIRIYSSHRGEQFKKFTALLLKIKIVKKIVIIQPPRHDGPKISQN